MALMILLTLVAIMSADRATLDVELSYNQLHSERAFYAADAGIKHAVRILNDSMDWRTGLYNEEIDGAHYSVAVIDSSGLPALADTVILRATATTMDAVGNVEAVVVPGYGRPFRYAAFGEDSVIMTNSSCTDSYNSDSGTYVGTQLDDWGDIGSNGVIDLSNTADVYGDAWTSMDDGINIDQSALAHGDTTSAAPQRVIDIIPQDEYDWADDNSNAPLGLSGSFHYTSSNDNLRLNSQGDTVQLTSGVYFFNDIVLSQQSVLTLAPGAEVTIYMTGNLSLGEGSALNPNGSPADLVIYSQGSLLEIGQHTEFRAGFYAPDANIFIEQNTSVYGALVGQSISLHNSACIHYDRALYKKTRGEVENMVVVAWHEN
jgi:hypothetical protein